MENTPSHTNPVLRTALLWGTATGLLCIGWVLFLHVTHNNPYGLKRTLSDFFTPVAAIGSQLVLRRFYPQGPGLGKAVGVGVLTTLLAAAVAASGMYVYAQLADPSLIQQHLAEARQLLENARRLYLENPNGRQQFEATLQGLAHTPAGFAQDEFLKKLLWGMFLSVPGGIFLRK